MTHDLSADALVEMVEWALVIHYTQNRQPCMSGDPRNRLTAMEKRRLTGAAREALAAVAQAAGLNGDGFRNVALLLDGERIAPDLAALLSALAEVSDA